MFGVECKDKFDQDNIYIKMKIKLTKKLDILIGHQRIPLEDGPIRIPNEKLISGAQLNLAQ